MATENPNPQASPKGIPQESPKELQRKPTEESTKGSVKELAEESRGTSTKGPAEGFTDQRMETLMGRLLQAGVLLASATVLLGGILYLKANANHPVNLRTFISEPADLRSATQLLRLLAHGNPAAIVQLGILFLIATPVARVIFAVIGFAIERDRLYVAVSLIVLAVLTFGLLH
jgi:uncharacterized membrane protein